MSMTEAQEERRDQLRKSVFLQFVVIPVFEKLEKKMPRKPWLILCYVPAAIFAFDIIASLIYRAVVK